MVTCTAPIFKEGVYRGCSTIDLKLEGLDELTQLDSEKEGGYIFVTDRNNKFLSFPDKSISKIYSGEGEKKSEDFIYVDQLAEKYPAFTPIASKLKAINDGFLKLNQPDEILIQELDESSYQINSSEAKMIAATLDKNLVFPEESTISFEIKDDILLNERCRVYIMFMPNTYWKVVTVIPVSKASQIPTDIANQVSSVAMFIVIIIGIVTLLFIHTKLLAPLKKMTLSLKEFSESEKLSYADLDDKQDNELGLLAHWFNVRSQMLEKSLHELKQAYVELDSARIKAEDGTKLKNEFLACMSHEIRTPMNAIIGMSQLLEDANLKEDEKNYLTLLQNSSSHLLAIIDDLLDISKLESRKMKIRAVRFTLHELISNVETILKEKALAKNIEFKIYLDSEIPSVMDGDIVRIKQVLLNLGDNAIKFTEHGHVHVHLNLISMIDEKIKLQGKVIDTGIGIKDEHISKLFHPFSQIDGSTTRRHEGTGLGLSICKNILELMEGKIDYEGKYGKGSSFIFEFVVEKGETSDILDTESKKNEVVHKKDSQPTILLAEDNLDNQLITERFLKKFNCNCITVKDGLEAVKKYKEGGIDLILMDWQMPKMDGLEATRRIRELESEADHVIVIALTANAMEGDREKCYEAGMDDYLAKPFQKEQLKSVLDRYLS
jgi:signal transduction histidine kinase/CheY-like chemotaxis protein